MLATGGACSGEIWISLPIWGLQFPSKYRRNSTAKHNTRIARCGTMHVTKRPSMPRDCHDTPLQGLHGARARSIVSSGQAGAVDDGLPPSTTADRRQRHCRQQSTMQDLGQYCNTASTTTPRIPSITPESVAHRQIARGKYVAWPRLTATGPEAFHQSREIRHPQQPPEQSISANTFTGTHSTPSFRGAMPGNFVARLAGGHFRRVPFAHQALAFYQRERNSWDAGASSIASVVGALSESGPSAPRLFATQLWPAGGTKKHPPLGSLSLLRHCCGMPSLTRFSPVCFLTLMGRLLILTPKLSCLDAPPPSITKIAGSTRKKKRGMFCAYASRAAQTGARMGAIASPIFDFPPRATSTTSCMMRVAALFLCRLRILP